MPSTGNFDLVAEITQAKLNELLQAAYQSSKIPHSVNVPAGTSFGPYQLSDGVVQISSNGLALVMAPPEGRGAEMKTLQDLRDQIAKGFAAQRALAQSDAEASAIAAISTQACKVALKCSNKCFHGLSNPRNASWSNTLLERVFVATFNHAVHDTLTASFQGK